MYKNEIENYIDAHKEEMIGDIFTLCRIDSEKMPPEEGRPYGPGAYKALQKALSIAEGYGFSITDYTYVGAIDMNNCPKQLDILAHLDVVPAGEGWTVTEPFDPILEDGKLYGRGTADDKGPAVAALYAMRAVKDLGIPLTKNVRLIVGTDEECGSSDLTHYYSAEEEAPMTFSPDGNYPVVNVEKGSLTGHFTASFEPSCALPKLVSIDAGIKFNVVPGKAYALIKGMDIDTVTKIASEEEAELGMKFELVPDEDEIAVTAIGEGSHASLPEKGNNALTGLLTFLTKLPFAECRQIELLRNLLALIPHGDVHGTALGIDMEDEISGRLTLAFDMLSVTDTSIDGTFDSRCPICSNNDNVLNVVKARMADAGLTLENDSMRAPHYVDGDSDFVRTLLRAYETYTGRKGECLSMGGGTYVHDLKNGVAFGAAMPDTDNHMHGADEFAYLDELLVSAKIFAQVIVDLCS